MTQETNTASVKSAVRTLDLLEIIANSRDGINFQQIKQASKIPDSSLSQLLNTLLVREYIIHIGARSGYMIGPAFLKIANSVSSALSIEDKINPICVKLCLETNESVILHQRKDDKAYIVKNWIPENQTLIYQPKIGANALLHKIAAGKIFLSALNDVELKEYFSNIKIEDFDKINQEIKQISKENIARNFGDKDQGAIGISCGIFKENKIIATLTFGVPSPRYDEKLDAKLCAALKVATAEIASII